jgi:hypothetical protein
MLKALIPSVDCAIPAYVVFVIYAFSVVEMSLWESG